MCHESNKLTNSIPLEHVVHDFGAKVNGVVVQVQDAHRSRGLARGAVATLVQDYRGVVTLALYGHVMPIAVVDLVPVQADHTCSAAKIETELKGTFDDL